MELLQNIHYFVNPFKFIFKVELCTYDSFDFSFAFTFTTSGPTLAGYFANLLCEPQNLPSDLSDARFRIKTYSCVVGPNASSNVNAPSITGSVVAPVASLISPPSDPT